MQPPRRTTGFFQKDTMRFVPLTGAFYIYGMNRECIRLVIADDHYLVREGLRTSLEKRGGIQLAGEAVNGKELMALVEYHHPDVVLTDLRMPELDGAQATRQIRKMAPATAILALSFMENIFSIVEVLEAGAMGYISKTAPVSEIIEAIHKVHMGIPYFCRTTGTLLGREIARSGFDPYKKFRPDFTGQQVRIIRMISKGMSSKQIADQLEVTVRTVESHRRNILDNLQIRNPVGIMLYAVKKGLVTMEELPYS